MPPQDNVRERPENANLKSLTLKEFTGLIFEKVRWQSMVSCTARLTVCSCCREPHTRRRWLQVPGLEPFKASLEEIYSDINNYKSTVPVRWGGWRGGGHMTQGWAAVCLPSACLGPSAAPSAPAC